MAKKSFLHFNGLPPAGPTTTRLWIESTTDADRVTSKAAQATFVKPIPGEIDEIVQAHPQDKKDFKDDWKRYRIEIVLAVDDPTVKDDAGHEKPPRDLSKVKVFKLTNPPKVGENWRCASCYRDRFKTMNFGQQIREKGQDNCVHCHRKIEEAGWTLWFRYSEMPKDVQLRIDRMFAPKTLNVIRTRWPDAIVKVGDEKSSDLALPST